METAILAIDAVEKMVPLFNRLVKLSYLTNAEHAEFIQLYKLLAARLDAVCVAWPRQGRFMSLVYARAFKRGDHK